MSDKSGTPATRKREPEPTAPGAKDAPADSASGNGAKKSAPAAPTAQDLAFYLQALLDHLPDKIYFKDASSRFMAISRQVAQQFGLEPREVLGKTDFDLFTKEHAEQAFRDEQEIIRTGVPLVNFEEKETMQGGIRWVSSTKMPLRDKDGRIIGTFGLSRDITDRKRMEEQLVRRTFYDPLTALPNRALFLNRLDQLCQENTRGLADTRAFAVISLNLDRFQGVNESLGHDGGDELILQIAKRWKECMSASDTLVRLGGDEFAVLIENVDEPGHVTKLADRMLEALAAPFKVRGTGVYVSASAGIVISDSTYERADQILRDGDIALHRAKAHGPSERQVFDAEMHRQAVLRLQLDTDLRRAVERRELCVHYQPIVDARARRVVGFEALVRWRHPEKGLLTPDIFIPVAEATGLIDRVGLLVLEQACRDLRRFESRRAAEPPLRMSVNLSAAQLRSVRLCEHIRQVLEETGAPPSTLIVELTESAILNDKTRARAALDQLRGLGVHIHIDDFGTGYSSLGHLHALPVDALKIDRTFVARLDTKDGSVEIVRAIMALAQALHLEAVAEGVETREQLAILRAMGCSQFQGFLFARTMPPEEVESWLASDPLAAF